METAPSCPFLRFVDVFFFVTFFFAIVNPAPFTQFGDAGFDSPVVVKLQPDQHTQIIDKIDERKINSLNIAAIVLLGIHKVESSFRLHTQSTKQSIKLVEVIEFNDNTPASPAFVCTDLDTRAQLFTNPLFEITQHALRAIAFIEII